MPLVFESSGSFSNIDKFLAKMQRGDFYQALASLAERGVEALRAATPEGKEGTGAASESWDYEIEFTGSNCNIYWTNKHVDASGTPIVILLQYGHYTGTGGYVQGRDFINPAIKPIFDEIADGVWREVTSA